MQIKLTHCPGILLYMNIYIYILYSYFIHICRNQLDVNSTDASRNQVRLPSAINAADCDCSYHAKKNRLTKNAKDGESDDDDDDDSDVDDA